MSLRPSGWRLLSALEEVDINTPPHLCLAVTFSFSHPQCSCRGGEGAAVKRAVCQSRRLALEPDMSSSGSWADSHYDAQQGPTAGRRSALPADYPLSLHRSCCTSFSLFRFRLSLFSSFLFGSACLAISLLSFLSSFLV